jgi:hypothetical protein
VQRLLYTDGSYYIRAGGCGMVAGDWYDGCSTFVRHIWKKEEEDKIEQEKRSKLEKDQGVATKYRRTLKINNL